MGKLNDLEQFQMASNLLSSRSKQWRGRFSKAGRINRISSEYSWNALRFNSLSCNHPKFRKTNKNSKDRKERKSERRAKFWNTSNVPKDEQTSERWATFQSLESKLLATRTVGRLIHNFVLNIWKHFKTFVNNGQRCLVNTRSLIGLQLFGELWADNLSRKSNDVQSGSTGMVKRTRIKVLWFSTLRIGRE